MKIAILHEMLIKLGGAEKVIESLKDIFPEADLYALIYDEEKVGKVFPKESIAGVPKITQGLFRIFKNQRFCLPFMPRAVESIDFSHYDVVISSSSGFAHGAITGKNTKLITYYHSPARYMWDWTNEYKKDIGWQKGIKGFIINRLFLKLRQWDFLASKRSDISLANSKNTQERIEKYFRKESHILYPSIETKRFAKKINQPNKAEKYYIVLSALTEFKKIEVAIEGFKKMKDTQLVIIGDGNYRKTLEEMSTDNIEFVGAKYDDKLVELVQNSMGLIFPGEEDFGIVPIEVMAAGKPVFAYRGGGLLETVLEGKTGDFFDNKEGEDFIEKFKVFDSQNLKGKYTSQNCVRQAEKFSKDIFEKKIKEYVYGK